MRARSVILTALRCGCWLIILGVARGARAGFTLQDVIDNVRANELLYDDLDVWVASDYSRPRAAPRLKPPLAAVVKRDDRVHYVRQGGLFRLDRTGTTENTERQSSRNRIRAFDGDKTRAHDDGKVANIIDRAQDDHDLIRPHMFLLRYGGHGMVPLSVYLSGTAAMLANPDGNWNNEEELRNTYEGEARVDGLLCHRVTLLRRKRSGKEKGRIELSLAEERNYIPVRMAMFNYMYSRDIPWIEGNVSALEEIEDGVWFPFEARIIGYDAMAILHEQRQELKTRLQYRVESVNLHPAYDIAYFRDVEFPDGTAVYELENGKIARSYRQGAPDSGAVEGSVVNRSLIYINAAIVAALATYLACRCWVRARRRKAASASERQKTGR